MSRDAAQVAFSHREGAARHIRCTLARAYLGVHAAVSGRRSNALFGPRTTRRRAPVAEREEKPRRYNGRVGKQRFGLIALQVQRDAVDRAAQCPRMPHRYGNHGDPSCSRSRIRGTCDFSTIAVCSSSINRFMPIQRLACSYGSTNPTSTGGGHQRIRHFRSAAGIFLLFSRSGFRRAPVPAAVG